MSSPAELEAWRLAMWDAIDEIRARRRMHWTTLSRCAGLHETAWHSAHIAEGRWPGTEAISALLTSLAVTPADLAAMVDRYVAIRTRARAA